jgi:hypothetical protein
MSRARKGRQEYGGGIVAVISACFGIAEHLQLLKDYGVLTHVPDWAWIIGLVVGLCVLLWAILAPMKDDDSGPSGGNTASADNQSQAGVSSGANSPVTNIHTQHNYGGQRPTPLTISGCVADETCNNFLVNYGTLSADVTNNEDRGQGAFLTNYGDVTKDARLEGNRKFAPGTAEPGAGKPNDS